MAFVLRTTDDFEFPVEIEVPTADGHKIESFTGRFRRLPMDEVTSLFAGQGSSTDREIADRVLVGWGQDVVDEAGQPVPVGEAERQALLSIVEVCRAVAIAYAAALLGQRFVAKN